MTISLSMSSVLANACLLMSLESILIDLTLRDMLQSPEKFGGSCC